MVKTVQPQTPQPQVFKRQFQQYLIRNTLTQCSEDRLTLGNFYITEDKNRVVKKPGYEILLENVSDVSFSCNTPLKMSFLYKDELIEYEFEIP